MPDTGASHNFLGRDQVQHRGVQGEVTQFAFKTINFDPIPTWGMAWGTLRIEKWCDEVKFTIVNLVDLGHGIFCASRCNDLPADRSICLKGNNNPWCGMNIEFEVENTRQCACNARYQNAEWPDEDDRMLVVETGQTATVDESLRAMLLEALEIM